MRMFVIAFYRTESLVTVFSNIRFVKDTVTTEECGQILIHVICYARTFIITFSYFMKLRSYKSKPLTDELNLNK
jgi:hypothetical protein